MVEKKPTNQKKSTARAKAPAKKQPAKKSAESRFKPGLIFAAILLLILLILVIMLVPKKEEEEKAYLMEQVDNYAVVRLYADGFDDLSLNDKLLAYHLYQAAVAGDPIAYDQLHRFAPRIKRLLENIIINREDIDSEVFEKIREYAIKFWANGCHYSTRNKEKILPAFTFQELKDAAKTAQENDADFGLAKGETLGSMLEGLKRSIFDPNYEPLLTAKYAPEGEDIITASAVNFYNDVTLREVEAFQEENPLNSRLVKRDGHLVEEVYRAGDSRIPPGRYADYLQNIIDNLRKAVEYAPAEQKDTIQKLIRYLQTGDLDDWMSFNIAWVDDEFPIDFINGFIESYDDPRSLKATYESFVFFVDKKTTKMMRDIAEAAPYFEEEAPWDDEYKKKDFKLPQAKSINILVGAGDGGPMAPAGINLPNEQTIREEYGSKSVLLSNAMDAYRMAYSGKLIQEFGYTEEEIERAEKYGLEAGRAMVALHEIVGHGSGKVSEALEDDPSTYLKEYYSTLEEARAELMALWNIHDSLLVDKGVLSDEEAAVAAYEAYPRSALIMLRRIKKGDVIEDDHMRATNMIVRYWLDHGSVALKDKDGKFYMVVQDIDDMREQAGELLEEVMRIKAEGDYDAAKKLVEKYAVKINTALRDQVVQRCKDINYPDYMAFVMPSLKLMKNDDGEVVDVKLEYTDNLIIQMLRWSQYVEVTEDLVEEFE